MYIFIIAYFMKNVNYAIKNSIELYIKFCKRSVNNACNCIHLLSLTILM